MKKDHTLVQWTMPKWAAELIFESVKLDSESIHVDRPLRKELARALDTITETELPKKSNMTERKFHRTAFRLEIISREPVEKTVALDTMHHMITQGGWSGQVQKVSEEELDGKQAASALLSHDVDPSFFDLMRNGDELRISIDESRRVLADIIESEKMDRAALEARYGEVWDPAAWVAEFELLGFQGSVVVVRRKSDNRVGSLLYQHLPRFYFWFEEDRPRPD